MEPNIALGAEERRLAIEAIATLVNIKNTLIELILKPAGVPPDLARRFLYSRDEAGLPLSKRNAAPLMLAEIEKQPDGRAVIRSVLEIASQWNSFHLSADEFQARATVQKAREILGILETMEAREAQQRDQARRETLERMQQERAEEFRRHNDLLLAMFDSIAGHPDPQQRGYLLQDFLNRLFDLYRIPVVKSFTRNRGAEQIDGAFKLEGWHYLVECRWREKLANIRQLDGLLGQITRSGKQTMGLFLSIDGWSSNVVPLLKQNQDKSIILMDGYDLRTVLSAPVDFRELILAKVAKLNLDTEPFFSVTVYLQSRTGQ